MATTRRGSTPRCPQSPAWSKRLVVTLVVLGLSLSVPVVALAGTCPTSTDPSKRLPENSSRFAYGWIRDASSSDHFDNLKSDIQARNPNLPPNCVGNFCFSYAWVMMSTSNPANDLHAQYGPLKGWYINHIPETIIGPGADFVECKNDTTNPTDYYDKYVTTTAVGSSPTYEIKFGKDPDNQSSNKIFLRNGTIEDWCGGNNGNDPFTFTPDEAQGATEIYDIGTQLPGSQMNHEQFRLATVHDATSGSTLDLFAGSPGFSWDSPAGTLQHRPWMGSLALANHQNYDFWDDDCP